MSITHGPWRRRTGRDPVESRLRFGGGPCRLVPVLVSLLLMVRSPGWADAAAASPGDAERGGRLYARYCAACHGSGGKGDGPGAPDLDPTPRDFTQGQFRFRTTATGQIPAPRDLERTIRKGLPGTAMPAFGATLSAREIADLTAHVMSFVPAAQEAGAAPQEVAMPAVPPASPASVQEGRNIYRIVECWACHGLDGSGRGTSAKGLVNEVGQPISPTDFRHAPLKGGRRPEDVVRTLLTGLNGTPMPSYGEAMLFAREDVADLSTDEGRLPKPVIDEMAAFIATCPGKDQIAALDEDGKRALRDRRLAALSHYVLSLRRNGLWSWLFRDYPEHEARP